MLQQDGPQDYLKALGKHMGVALVVCVIPNSRVDRYVAVKRHVCMVMAAPSQVSQEKTRESGGRGIGKEEGQDKGKLGEGDQKRGKEVGRKMESLLGK